MGSAESQTRLVNRLQAIRDTPEPLRYGRLLRSLEERLFDRATTSLPRIARYELREVVGRGGCGIVYRAWDPELEREVALKLLLLSRVGRTHADPIAALLHEARSAARLSHPSIVAVYDFGTFDPGSLWAEGPDPSETGCAYVVMELIEGRTLGSWQKQKHGWREVLRVFLEAGRGLAAAHAAGVVHHDFKPANVMVSPDGRARVLDFGLAGLAQADPSDSDDLPTGGTPAYMAPEQHEGRRGDARSDQYAFCVALWEALAGERPFRGKGLDDLERAKNAGPPRPPSKTRVPRAVFRLLARGLGADPDERFAAMDELLPRLESVLRRRWIALGTGAALACLGLGVAAGTAAGKEPGIQPLTCEADPSEAFAEVWNERRAGEIDEAFARSELSYAGDAAQAVRDGIERYRQDWLAAHARVCAIGEPDRARSALDCLDRRRGMLSSLLAVLGEARPTTIRRAVEAIEAVPGPDACTSSAVLDLDEGEGFQDELGRGWALLEAGQNEDVLAVAERHREPEGARSRARWGFLVGSAHLGIGDEDAAREVFHDALLAAAQVGDVGLEIRLSTGLAHLDLQRGDHEGSRERLELARAKLDRGYTRYLDALVTRQEAGLFLALSDYEAFQHLAERYLELEGEDSSRASTMRVGLAGMHSRLGHDEKAIAILRDVLAQQIASLGEHHPDVAYTRASFGATLLDAGQPEEALLQVRAALETYEALTLPEQHGRLVALLNEAMALQALGRPLTALESARQGHAVTRDELDSGHLMAAGAAIVLAEVLLRLGRPHEAVPIARSAYQARKASFGPEHPQTQNAAALLEAVELDAGTRSLDAPALSVEMPKRPETRLDLLEDRARVAAHQDDPDRAREMLARLGEEIERSTEVSERARAEAWVGYADALELLGEQEAALEASRSADALEHGPGLGAVVATVRTRALLGVGRDAEARHSAEVALRLATEAGLEGPRLAEVHLARARVLSEHDPAASAEARRAAKAAFAAAGTEAAVIERIEGTD